jgi:hypothetical protein
MFNGTVQAWTNGNNSIYVQPYNWTARGVVMDSVGTPGQSIIFANLGGFGRADSVDVAPDTAAARIYFNTCPNQPTGTILNSSASLDAYFKAWKLGVILLLILYTIFV